MKRILAWLLILTIVLSGCGGQPPAEPTLPAESQTTTAPVESENQMVPSAPDETEAPSIPPEPVCDLELTLLGQSNMTLEYGHSYEDPGAQAFVSGEEPVPVQVEGAVLPELGEYIITYRASYRGVEKTAQRKVTVVDTTAPTITLVSDPEGSYVLPGGAYQEAGFTATDNHDGDITDRVERQVEGDRIRYTATDSSGNSVTVYRSFLVDDPVPPELTLKGEGALEITAGEIWKDPGFSASDNVDGNLTAKVRIFGRVDSQTVGVYTLTYQVSDGYGNTVSAQRTVIVKAPKPQIVEPNGKVIYLTFDDGPSDYTPRLLEILEQYGVKATFFVINTDRMDLLDDIVAGGHTLALHTKTHRYDKIYSSEKAFFEDLYALQDIIYQKTGLKPTLMRFPGGSSNRVSKKYCTGIMTALTKSVQEQGFRYFDWNVDSDDAGSATTSNQVFQNVKKGVKANQYSVVLQHDTRSYSVAAVEEIIIWGLENGYTFLPLDETSPECHHSWVKN